MKPATMKPADFVEMTVLAAIWGASFLFMRLAVPEFGAVPLAAVRVAGASLFLLPILAWRGELAALRTHWKPLLVVGIINSALPFLCFSYAAQSITAGLSSIFNATTPLWGTLIAMLWLKDRLTPARAAGLALGFASVLWLAWDKASFKPGGSGWAVVACVAAAMMYGLSASWTKRFLGGVPPVAQATGSQVSAALALALPAAIAWPAAIPSASAWAYTMALAFLCSGVAYILYFRLIARIGPSNAISVTFLIPVFAVVWGGLILAEPVGATMVLACLGIVAGTCLTVGLWQPAWLVRRSA